MRLNDLQNPIFHPERVCDALTNRKDLMIKFRDLNALDKTPPLYIHLGWHPEPKYRPIEISLIVRWALFKKLFFDQALEESKAAGERLKQEKRRLDTKIKNINKLTGEALKYIPRHSQPYIEAIEAYDKASIKRKNILKSATKPNAKFFDQYCLDMLRLLKNRSGKPNYSIIASIANFFHISPSAADNQPTRQTAQSIRQRIHRINTQDPPKTSITQKTDTKVSAWLPNELKTTR